MFEFLEKLYEAGVEVNVSLGFNKNRKRVESLINTYENFSKNKKGVYVEPKENPLKSMEAVSLALKSFSTYSMKANEKQSVTAVVDCDDSNVVIKFTEPISKIMLDPVKAQSLATGILIKCQELAQDICNNSSKKDT